MLIILNTIIIFQIVNNSNAGVFLFIAFTFDAITMKLFIQCQISFIEITLDFAH